MQLSERFDWGKQTYVMGIINATPDSFSGDGIAQGANWIERAVAQGKQFIADGAHILDIGGESTRPGAELVSAAEEQQRVIPVIEALAAETDAILSIDTYKASVADAALNAGAHIVNDVWGFKLDPDIAAVTAAANAPAMLMHNRSKPKELSQQSALGGRYVGSEYDNLIADIIRELLESVQIATKAGIPKEQIVLDPGIGFGKTVEQNLELTNRLDEIARLGYPILYGPSRKSFIGYTLDLPPHDRVEGTAATCTVGIMRGADIIRVHDVKEMARVACMTDAICRG